MIFCVLLHSTQERMIFENLVLNFRSQILSHTREENVLFILVTDNAERDKHFVQIPGVNLWIVDEKEGQLRIYDDMPDDFFGLKYGIQNTVAGAGKRFWENPSVDNESWKTSDTSTSASYTSYASSGKRSSTGSVKRTTNKLKRIPFVTIALIAINVIWFIILLLKGDPSKASYMASMGAAFGPYVFEDHQFWRILTSMFMHFSLQHLMGNMIYLGIAGYNLETNIGHIKYAVIYLLSGIAAGLISCAFYYSTGNYAVSAGASGAIYGLIGAVVVLTFKNRGRMSKAMMWVRVGIVLLFLFYSNFTNSQVDAVAHIAGFVFGIILTIFFYGGRKKKR